MSEPEILTVKECAEYLRVSTSKVRRLIWEGHIRCLNLHGAVRVHRKELEKSVGIGDTSGYRFSMGIRRKLIKNDYDKFLELVDSK